MSLDERLLGRLHRLVERHAEIEALLADPGATQDLDRFRRLSREHVELGELVAAVGVLQAAERDRDEARALLADPELRYLAQDELQAAQARASDAEDRVQRLLLPRDPDDARPVFLEIRAGTGGDESALFAGDLLRMYLRHAERRGWRAELVSASASDLGGWKEAICRIEGEGVYGRLRFESGVHRVQRVPVTESQGRIHTSACTVAVMPEADAQQDLVIPPEQLRIDVFRASGAGGQHVNKTESAVRITHLPTGIVAECQDDRSQHRNRERAMTVLAARLKDRETRERQAKEAAQRKSLVGSGDRSERIRTYNFPQGRVTDHRIELTLHKLPQVMEGDLDDLLDALQASHQAEQLAALSTETA